MHLTAFKRTLAARKRSDRTVQSYQEAILLLAEFHNGADVTELDQAAIEEFMADQLKRHKASSAGNRFRSLRAFYNWCVAEEILDRSPMARMIEPEPTDKAPPVLPDDKLTALLKACGGKDFEDRRDTAIIRLWCEPGSPRVAEMAGLDLDDFDLAQDQVTVHGKGDRIRVIPFGAKTGQAIDRYLRVRTKHRDAKLPAMWLAKREGIPITASGLAQMLRRRAEQAGIGHVHPHQLRHTSAHVFADEGGSDGDAMVLFGWRSPDMPRRYGRSAAAERARRTSRRMSPADRL
jgi:site-specific recombinase XerD